MKYKDWCLWADTPGAQVSISLLLAALSFTGFLYTYYASLYWPLFFATLVMGTFLMLSCFYLGYSLMLSYLMLKKYYF